MYNRQVLLHNCQETLQNENGDLSFTKLAKSFLLAFAICLKTCDLVLPFFGRIETSQSHPTTGYMGSCQILSVHTPGPAGSGDNKMVAGRGKQIPEHLSCGDRKVAEGRTPHLKQSSKPLEYIALSHQT